MASKKNNLYHFLTKKLLPLTYLDGGALDVAHMIWLVLTLPLTVLKLFTEVLPAFLRRACELIPQLLTSAVTANTNILVALGIQLICLLAQAGVLFFHACYLLGRALTSPHKSLHAAWNAGTELIDEDNMNTLIYPFLFAGASLLLTLTVYALTLPLVLYFSAFIGLPLESLLAHAIEAITHIAVPVLEPIIYAGAGAVLGIVALIAGASVSWLSQCCFRKPADEEEELTLPPERKPSRRDAINATVRANKRIPISLPRHNPDAPVVVNLDLTREIVLPEPYDEEATTALKLR